MKQLLSCRETYRFTCRHCGHRREQVYDVSHWMDPEGDEHVVFSVDGVVCCAPWSSEACRACGDYRLDVVLQARASAAPPGADA
jgi:hypothetical protein